MIDLLCYYYDLSGFSLRGLLVTARIYVYELSSLDWMHNNRKRLNSKDM